MSAARRRLPRRQFARRAAYLGALAAAVLGTGVGLAIAFVPWLGGIEQQTLSARFSLRGAHHPRDVTIVAIDDRSFGLLHQRWPFPRSWHGQVLERLHRAGARAVFYDVQFTEPTTPAQDGALFDALGRTGGAVLATTETDGHGHSNVLGGDANLAMVHSRAAASDFPVGVGGTIDRLPFELGGLDTPAIAMAARLGRRLPPRSLFGHGGAYIDFQGPPGSFPTLSFADVLRGRFPASAVRGRVVVVGATSPTLQDVHATPASGSELMSGPELQANSIWTVLHGLPLRDAPPVAVVLAVALLALLAPLAKLRSARALAVAAPLAAAAYLAAVQVAFDAGTVMPVVGPLVALALSAVVTLVVSHLLMNRELRVTQLEIVHRLGRAAEARDGDSGRHLERIAFLCQRLARAAGLRRADARLISRASALHDVGKIGVPDEVLLKTGTFDAADRAVMQCHAADGARMLAGSSTSLVQIAEVMALTHHERWDGTGYPAGLAGEQIPLVGRICAICDVFDALVSRRRYKESWTLEQALAELRRGSGTHFDPRLVSVFLGIAPRLFGELQRRIDPALGSGLAGARPERGHVEPDVRQDERVLAAVQDRVDEPVA
ncbi:MAG: CHASE2 domain-containing protein [Actinocrinis sp.]